MAQQPAGRAAPEGEAVAKPPGRAVPPGQAVGAAAPAGAEVLKLQSKTRNWAATVRDLDAEGDDVRAAAAADLAVHVEAHRSDVARHLRTALDDPAPEVRAAAAVAAADGGVDDIVDALVAATEDEVDEVVAAALTALGELRAAPATPAVSRCLEHPAGPVRFQAVIAYPRVQAERSPTIDALLRASHDEDPFVRHIALRMAEEVGGEPEAKPTAVVYPVFISRARALLDDDHDAVRVAAAVILARAGRRDGVPILARVAAREIITSEADDESAAIELCGTLRIEAARAPLRKRAFGRVILLQRDPFAWQARVALAAMGDSEARGWIISELDAWTRERRTLAVAAAGRAGLSGARPKLEAMRQDPRRAAPEAVAEALALIEAHDRDDG
ncbi:MAG: HEAT repeat domain-containing protein [Myxococcota bacterium]